MAGAAQNKDVDVLRRLRELGVRWQEPAEAVGRQLNELQLLLRQTTTELDRLSPRNSDAAQRLRDMEAHLESYTRGDIKDVYAAAQESQMRFFMMQLQREQIEHKQQVLSAYRDSLVQIVGLAEHVVIEDDAPQERDGGEPSPTESPQESVARIIQTQEEERRRVSRQIHDGPAQALANVVLRAEICERLMDMAPDQARRELLSLKRLVTDSLQETRHFIFDVRPMILEDLGLIPTLRRYCEMLGESAGVPLHLNVLGSDRRLNPAVEIAVFRVVQEAIRNALQHGEPTSIQIGIDIEAQSITVTIQDDGRGCDCAEAMAGALQGKTVGLAHIQEYVRSLNGTFNFESAPAQGSCVTASLPLAQTKA